MASNHRIDPAADCESILALIPDYAFGLSTPAEKQFVEANLADCTDARAQLEDYRSLQDAMRAEVREVEPPADFETRLMAAAFASMAEPLKATPTILPAPVKPRRPVWQGVAVAALIVLVASNLFWVARLNDLNRQKDDLSNQLAQINGSPNTLVLNNSMAIRWVRMPAAEKPDTAAFIMWNENSKTGVLCATNFPKLQAGTTYQLWLTRNETRTSVGTFKVDEQGRAALLFQSNEPIDKFTWAWITAEPGNGSATPNEDAAVIKGKLPTTG